MAEPKSKPFKSPWGIHKTRMTLLGRRIDVAIGRTRTGRKSIIPQRMFDARMDRFSTSWSPRHKALAVRDSEGGI